MQRGHCRECRHARIHNSDPPSSASQIPESIIRRSSAWVGFLAMQEAIDNNSVSIIGSERTLTQCNYGTRTQERAQRLNERTPKGSSEWNLRNQSITEYCSAGTDPENPTASDGATGTRLLVQLNNNNRQNRRLRVVKRKIAVMNSRVCSSSMSSEPWDRRPSRKSCLSSIETVTQTSDGLKRKLVAPALKGRRFDPIELGPDTLEERWSDLINPIHPPNVPRSLSELEQRCDDANWRYGAQHSYQRMGGARATPESPQEPQAAVAVDNHGLHGIMVRSVPVKKRYSRPKVSPKTPQVGCRTGQEVLPSAVKETFSKKRQTKP